MALTDKQKRFCEEYVIDWNATRSAIAAGYSEKTAYSIGQENLKKPEISGHIEKIKNNLQELSGISSLRIILELKRIALMEDDTYEKASDRLKAIEVINKMLGYNSPDKIDHTTAGEPFKGFNFLPGGSD